jgi:hypothetical protein
MSQADDLLALASSLHQAYAGFSRVRGVPDQLASSFTLSEPHRLRALADFELLQSFPLRADGLGRTCKLLPLPSPEPHQQWEQTISPVSFRVAWAKDMSGVEWEHVDATIDRVAWEDGAWRVVSLLSNEQRSLLEELLQGLEKARA